MFIYKITNIKNNKIYIGQSIRPINERFKRHINDAVNNVINTHFANAIRKYGKENFILELIDTAKTQEELNIKEQEYIRKYDSIKNGYNETDALNKCGGNTYKSKSKDEMAIITKKISESKIGIKNPNHKEIKVRNEMTKEEFLFNTVSECQNFFKEKHHRFITTRVTGKTKSLYLGKWNIAYKENDYFQLFSSKIVHSCNIEVNDLVNNSILKFNSVRKMCETLNINRNLVKKNKDVIIGKYKIVFK